MRLGTDTASVTNWMMGNSKAVTPTIGMGVTFLMWTDRHAGTVVEVSADGKCISIQRDNETRTDNNGMSECQSYDFSPCLEAVREIFTFRSNGKWVRKGESMKGGSKILLGHRAAYHDYSF